MRLGRFITGERGGTKAVGANSCLGLRSLALSLGHLNDWRKPGAGPIRGLRYADLAFCWVDAGASALAASRGEISAAR